MNNLETNLSNQEILILVGLMENQDHPGSSVEKCVFSKGFTSEFDAFTINMAIARLVKKEMIITKQSTTYQLTSKGEDWLFENEDSLSTLIVTNEEKSPF